MNEIVEPHAFSRSACAVANGLDLFGDKWTLLIIRDLLLGKARYGEFIKSPEGIPTNILANRLKELEQSGLIRRKVYSEKPLRYEYELTQKGRDLKPILVAMADWGKAHIPGSKVFPLWMRKA